MGSKTIPILLVTANVGSIFEDPSVMLKIWTQEFLSTVTKLDPKFIALHCQEVGGKNYERSMKYVENFVKLLMGSEELRLFDKVRVYIDEDYSSAENFTALGNLYFIHESLTDVLTWDFKEMAFVEVKGNEVFTGNIESVVTKEKAKFPQNFFPECKWSRKGFLRTRWSISGTIFDLVNIHLFHDASNFIAMESSPSVYCKNRRRALEHTLQHFHTDKNGIAPFFLFGDFNFRTDTDGVVKKLTEGLKSTKVQNNKTNEFSKIQFHDKSNQLVLTVGKKEFNHHDHQDVFLNEDISWLKQYDKEMEAFENQLIEFPLEFPPSYPFEENVSHATTFMQTRCPSWCDRILLSHTAQSLLSDERKIEYNIMGKQTCMGDHKPVYLVAAVRPDSGRVTCCAHLSNECSVSCTCCKTYAIQINVTDLSDRVHLSRSYPAIDASLLHEPYTRSMLVHDPYTPESAESRSPQAENEGDVTPEPKIVSPGLLKSRLEDMLKVPADVAKHTSLARSRSRYMDDPKEAARQLESSRRVSRARLISTSSGQSTHRLQSHHSSSDEEWFEFDEDCSDVSDDIFQGGHTCIATDSCNNPTTVLKTDPFDKPAKVKKHQRACCILH